VRTVVVRFAAALFTGGVLLSASACDHTEPDAAKSATTHAAPVTSTAPASAVRPTSPAAVLPTTTAPAAPAAMTSAAAAPRVVAIDVTTTHRQLAKERLTVTTDSVVVRGFPAAVSAALEEPAQHGLDGFIGELDAPDAPPFPSDGSVSSYTATFETTRADTDIVSGLWSITEFVAGAAHPGNFSAAVIVDAHTGVVLPTPTLFADRNMSGLANAVRPLLRARMIAEDCPTMDNQIAQGTAPTAANYAATAVAYDGLRVSIPPYQIAPYACGGFDVLVPWSTLRGELSEQGSQIAKGSGDASANERFARCRASGLRVELEGEFEEFDPSAQDQHQAKVVFTNTSQTACYLQGFPGVDLESAGHQPYSLPRTSDAKPHVLLLPHGAAQAVLTYLTGPDLACDSSGAWTPTTVAITPPDDTTTMRIPWLGDSVDDCQSGATHPGSYIGPVTPRI